MADVDAWGEAGKKYVIHRETFSAFELLKNMAVKAYEEMTPEELRSTSLRKSEVMAGQVDFEGSEREMIVPCEKGQGVPVSVYKPAHIKRVPAVWVYFHGGGLISGSRNVYVTMLKTLARRAGCIVVNVEYRLAPENKAPAAFDDCRAVTRWVLANKTLVGGHEDSQVGVGGDSAGGHLTASITHDVPGLAFQILIYPQTDLTLSAPSYSEFADTPGLNRNHVVLFNGQFLVNEGQRTDPVLSPYHRPSFPPTLPPALCILAELDPLRDDGLAYCDKLKAAGVATEVLMVKGATHGFFHLAAHYKELTREPYEKCLQLINRFQSA